MPTTVPRQDLSHHLGRRADALLDAVKAMLVPLEDVCRYREQRARESGRYDVRPRRAGALAFSIAVAPGGYTIDSAALLLKELPLEEDRLALDVIAAIIEGRLRRVSLLARPDARPFRARTTVRDSAGLKLIAHTQRRALLWPVRAPIVRRERFLPYRG